MKIDAADITRHRGSGVILAVLMLAVASSAVSWASAPINVQNLSSDSKIDQTITFSELPGKTYGNADFAAGASASSGLPVSYSSSNTLVATVDASGVIHITGAGTSDITASQAGDDQWNAAESVSRRLYVSKANQVITFAELPGKIYGNADFAAGASASSGLAVAYSSSNTTVATVDASGTLHITGTGASDIIASQGGDSNWNAADSVSRRLNVSMGNQVITFGELPVKTFGDADFPPGATINSGLTISYSSSDSSVATITSDSKIHIVSSGKADITASQAGDANWNAASATQTLTVKTLYLTVTFVAGEGGSISGDTPQTMAYGSPTGSPVTAVPNQDYVFVKWISGGASYSTLNPLMIEKVTTNMTVTALFAPIVETCSMIMAVSPEDGGGGSVKPTSGSSKIVPTGAPMVVTAYPVEGWYFSGWSSDKATTVFDDPLSTATTIKLYEDSVVTGIFSRIAESATLTISVTPSGAGSTSPVIGESSVATVTPIDIAATAADGYYFLRWRLSGAAVVADTGSAATTVTVSGPAALSAVFSNAEPTTVLLKMISSPNALNIGVTTPAVGTSTTISANDAYQISACPASDWEFVCWKASSSDAVFGDGTAAITTVSTKSNTTVTAYFVEYSTPSTISLTYSSSCSEKEAKDEESYYVTDTEKFKITIKAALPSNTLLPASGEPALLGLTLGDFVFLDFSGALTSGYYAVKEKYDENKGGQVLFTESVNGKKVGTIQFKWDARRRLTITMSYSVGPDTPMDLLSVANIVDLRGQITATNKHFVGTPLTNGNFIFHSLQWPQPDGKKIPVAGSVGLKDAKKISGTKLYSWSVSGKL